MRAPSAGPALLVPPLDGAPPPAPAGPVRELAGEALGTTWRVLHAGDPAVAAAEVAAVLDGVAEEMSAWRPGSALSRFNRAPAGTWLPLPHGLLAVLRCALAVAEATGGAFDPTVGALSDAWGFGPSLVPAAPPAEPLRPLGWRRLRIDRAGRAFQPGGLRLDVGGIGKGWAADRVADLLARRGVPASLAEVGGELVGRGVRPDGRPWMVALEPARAHTPSPATVALHTGALATSGDLHRQRRWGDRIASHSFDPATGRPAETGVVCATVWARTALEADAWATALIVLGAGRGVATADAHGVAALLACEAEGAVRHVATRAWAAMSDG